MEKHYLAVIGAFFILIGFVLISIYAVSGDTETKAGGAVFIGPIPIIFGLDRGIAVTAAVLGLITLVALHLLNYI